MIKEVIYSERGGLRYKKGRMPAGNSTYPFAHLILEKEKLTITYPFKRIILPKENIISIEPIKRDAISSGIRIHHKQEKTAELLIFWSFNVERISNVFRDAGWPVK